MIVATDYNSSTAWPGMICDAIYISGNPFLEVPQWAPYPDLYAGKFNSRYYVELSTAEHIRYITGGEPFCYYIEYFIEQLYRTLHCPIRIDTDGAYPFRLMKLLQTQYISHAAVRLWYPPDRYKIYKAFPPDAIKESLKIIAQFPSSEVLIPYDPNYTTIDTIEEALSWNDNVVVKVIHPATERVAIVYGPKMTYDIDKTIAELTSTVKSLARSHQNIEVI